MYTIHADDQLYPEEQYMVYASDSLKMAIKESIRKCHFSRPAELI